ncbi:hypothetical protein VOLCADRAFT_103251 [Volvox carteri f. nagariensis]|uniref:Reticulon-like protein n=1 Tax=Volvox carteri f. nagariensis TaxID=3068 RepID=D8TKH7_VOLCA|nr:uncharacterized protein VOLCADRAFT_103251 [Volvox carteri f. nagariensis]EFJ52248.1 hypothetical protein VOLCADRAFT_103251 [Volvox carteri f. nagariensis]|eukprot:XP_002947022.1 hypothetical protein VOLCADRAFT_103251 [Volvox carteri f. nagariensis]
MAMVVMIQVLNISAPPEQLLAESEPLLAARWAHAPLLPGALRLVRHLAACGVPFAIATSTPRATFAAKMSLKTELRELLVAKGKPYPDVFLEAAKRLNVVPERCLVLEDAPSGVEGATAAGMRVVVVPSLVGTGTGTATNEYGAADPSAATGVVEVLPSLLAFSPAAYGLPPFTDLLPPPTPAPPAASPSAPRGPEGPLDEADGAPVRIGGHLGDAVIPMDRVIRIRGKVVKGFGRGSKVKQWALGGEGADLGIPTANVDPEAVAAALAEAVTGIYAGWARVGNRPEVHKTVLSIGWNPFFGNKEKTLEPWILHSFDEPFYGETLSLVICGYVRPEANFSSLEALIARIHADAEVSRAALDWPPLAGLREDPFLTQLQLPSIEAGVLAVEALLFWRNPKDSGVVFGGATAAFLAYVLNPFSASTIICYAVAIASLATFLWAQMGNIVGRSGPPVPALLTRGLSEDEARKFTDAALPVLNKALATIGVLASGKDLKLSLLVVGGAYSAARVFAAISPVTLVYVVVLIAFTAPKIYELKQDEIDKVLATVKSKVNELTAKFSEVVSKIPKASGPKKAQ